MPARKKQDQIREFFNDNNRVFSQSSHVLLPQNSLVPTVVEKEGTHERAFDLFSRLMRDRVIYLNGVVDTSSASVICGQLDLLDSQDKKLPIKLYINSGGGSISDGMAMYDTIRNIEAPVMTIGRGMQASMGSFLLSSGAPGMRYILPGTEVMVHQPRTQGGGGTESEWAVGSQHISYTREKMQLLYTIFMGLDDTNPKHLEAVDKLMERDTWLNSIMVKKLGLADVIWEFSSLDPKAITSHNYPKELVDRERREYEAMMRLYQRKIDEVDPENYKDPRAIVKQIIQLREDYLGLNRPAAPGRRRSGPANDL